MAFQPNANYQRVVDAALSESARTGRRILIEYGGDWCIWSKRMEAALATPRLASFVAEKFVFLKCHVDPGGTWDESSIDLPPMKAVPYFSLVGSDGEIIAHQGTEGFEFLWFYRKSAILRFLEDWARR